MVNYYSSYKRQTPDLAFIAGWFNGAVYTPYYSFDYYKYNQGASFSTDAFYLGEDNSIPIVEAMKNRMRGNWFGSYTDLDNPYDEAPIIEALDFEIEPLSITVEQVLEDGLKTMLKTEFEDEVQSKATEFDNIVDALKFEILGKDMKVYTIKRFKNDSAFRLCYQYIHFETYFIVGDEYAVMLALGNSD